MGTNAIECIIGSVFTLEHFGEKAWAGTLTSKVVLHKNII